MSDGSFRSIIAPSGCQDSFVDLDSQAIRALSRDPQRRVWLADVEDPDAMFRPAVKIITEFSYPEKDGELQERLEQQGFRFAVLQPPNEPFQTDACPYGFGAHEDVNVICHTNYRWVRQGALDQGKDMRPLQMALSRVRAVDGVQVAAFMAPYTLFYSVAKLFHDRTTVIEKNVEAALQEAAEDFEKSYNRQD